MNAIGKFVLRARAWHIFLVVVGAYFASEIILIFSASEGGSRSEASLALIPMYVVFAWLWFLGLSLNLLLKPEFRRSGKALTGVLLFCAAYFLLLSRSSGNQRLLNILGPLGIAVFLCFMYVFDFVASSLTLAEKKKAPTFYEFLGPFFLLWFFPIGIWFLQPRVNRVYAKSISK
jgi:hypothetical protein